MSGVVCPFHTFPDYEQRDESRWERKETLYNKHVSINYGPGSELATDLKKCEIYSPQKNHTEYERGTREKGILKQKLETTGTTGNPYVGYPELAGQQKEPDSGTDVWTQRRSRCPHKAEASAQPYEGPIRWDKDEGDYIHWLLAEK